MHFAYPVTIKRAREGGYVVSFPDFPEAFTQGETITEALQEATDCLDEAVAGRIRRGEAIPTPTSSSPRRGRQVMLSTLIATKAALSLALRTTGMSKTALARRLGCDEKEVRRLLDPRHPSRLQRLEAALHVVGRRLVVEFENVA